MPTSNKTYSTYTSFFPILSRDVFMKVLHISRYANTIFVRERRIHGRLLITTFPFLLCHEAGSLSPLLQTHLLRTVSVPYTYNIYAPRLRMECRMDFPAKKEEKDNSRARVPSYPVKHFSTLSDIPYAWASVGSRGLSFVWDQDNINRPGYRARHDAIRYDTLIL